MARVRIALALVLLLAAGQQGASLAASPLGPGDSALARAYFADRDGLARLAAETDIWEVHHDAGFALVMVHDAGMALRRAGFQVEMDEARTAMLTSPARPLPGQVSGIPGYPCYRTVEETLTAMAGLAQRYPHLATWRDIGDSWERVTPGGQAGYDLSALVLTRSDSAQAKARFVLLAELHAREYATAELAARFAEELLSRYDHDPVATWLLEHTEVHVLPMLNPDGRKRAEGGYYWRKNTDGDDGCPLLNALGTDLNRNFPAYWGGASASPCAETYQGPAAASEPETQAVRAYLADLFGGPDAAAAAAGGLVISLHSYGGLVLFPWGWSDERAPDSAELQVLGQRMAFHNHYQVQPAAALYPASGTADDWIYATFGVPVYTFEVGYTFFEPCDSFEAGVLPGNTAALWYAARAARQPLLAPGGPETVALSTTLTAVVAGAPLTLTALADSTRSYPSPTLALSQTISAARYSVDAPPWAADAQLHALAAADGQWGGVTETLQALVDTTGWATGRHVVWVECMNAAGRWGVPGVAFIWIRTSRDRVHLPLVAAMP